MLVTSQIFAKPHTYVEKDARPNIYVHNMPEM